MVEETLGQENVCSSHCPHQLSRDKFGAGRECAPAGSVSNKLQTWPAIWWWWWGSLETNCDGTTACSPCPICPTLPRQLPHTLTLISRDTGSAVPLISPSPEKNIRPLSKGGHMPMPTVPHSSLVLPSCISVPGLLDQGSPENFPEGPKRGGHLLSPARASGLQLYRAQHLEACLGCLFLSPDRQGERACRAGWG